MMTLVMTLPVVHHINDEVEFRVLFVQRKCRGQDPRSNGHDEQVPNGLLLDHLAELSNGFSESAILLCLEERIVSK